RFATSRTMPDAAYDSPKAALRNGRSGASAPWFMSTTRWPRASKPSTRASGRTRTPPTPLAGSVSTTSGARRSAGGGRVTRVIVHRGTDRSTDSRSRWWPLWTARDTLGPMQRMDGNESQARRYHRRQFALMLGDVTVGVALLVWWSWSGAAGRLAAFFDAR